MIILITPILPKNPTISLIQDLFNKLFCRGSFVEVYLDPVVDAFWVKGIEIDGDGLDVAIFGSCDCESPPGEDPCTQGVLLGVPLGASDRIETH